MPWTPEEFRRRHAKRLSRRQAERASSIANAILREGGDEGAAIATGISRAKTNTSPKGLTGLVRRTRRGR